jgi:type VI secretion system protein
MKYFSLILLLALASCASPSTPTPLKSIQLSAMADANSSSATMVDVVFVYDTAASAGLPATSPDWFQLREALLARMPGSISVLRLDVPPPYPLVEVALPSGYAKAVGVYVYASYLAPAGQPRCNLTPYQQVSLRLLNDRMECAGR